MSSSPTHSQPRSTDCDAIYGLTSLDRNQLQRLHQGCTDGLDHDAVTYSAIFRLVSAPGGHARAVARILRRHREDALLVWADGGTHDPPPSLAAQQAIDAGLPGFAKGLRCSELRASDDLAEFLDAIAADDEPERLPFTSGFAACLGVPAAAMEGTRLLTIRADGLEDVTVVVGTRDFVSARRFEPADALHLGSHRFHVVALPEASPVAVFANHENLELPIMWQGLMGRNAMIWARPPRHSCLDLSVDINPGTHLYLDGVRVDADRSEHVCSPAGASAADASATQTVDRTIAITLDTPDSGIPDHEITALTCDQGRPVVRHMSPIASTVPAARLRRAGECEALRLDLRVPDRRRVAVLDVTKLPGCEATPLWASDIQERVRHVLEQDAAHRGTRSYTNFSAYAEASEALSSLATQMGGPADDAAESDRGTDTNTLLSSAAQQAWRQGIDTLLSLDLQCTPRGGGEDREPQWAYSLRATSIEVSDLFARGYYSREGIDLENFIDVESVGFSDADQQDASLGSLLDRVFLVDTPRFTPPPVDAHYRRDQTLRISRYFEEGEEQATVPEEVTIAFKAFHPLARRPGRDHPRVNGGRKGPPRSPLRIERPRLCERLVHRGARPKDAIEAAREAYAELPGDEQQVVLERSRDELDISSNPRAAVHKGNLRPPRPGWYMITIKDDPDGPVQDAVCINATAHAIDLYADLALSGRPLAFAANGTRAQVYVRPRVGVTWYAPNRWFGGGFTLGYGFTDFAGTRGDWKDLEVSVVQDLRWQRHALLLTPHAELRTRTTMLPVEFRARFGVTADAGLLDIDQVDRALMEFRGGNSEDVVLDLDADLNLDLIVGAPVGPVQIQGLIMLSYVAVNDSLRRSATLVTENANLFLGFGLGISGGRR